MGAVKFFGIVVVESENRFDLVSLELLLLIVLLLVDLLLERGRLLWMFWRPGPEPVEGLLANICVGLLLVDVVLLCTPTLLLLATDAVLRAIVLFILLVLLAIHLEV